MIIGRLFLGRMGGHLLGLNDVDTVLQIKMVMENCS